MQQADVIVLGAGASGMLCAYYAGMKGLKVVVLDHAPKAGAKVRISGGGKCNFTNANVSPANYICQNPHFVKSALARFSNYDFIDLVDSFKIPYEEREFGRLFTLEGAGQIVHLLRELVTQVGGSIELSASIDKVSYQDNSYVVSTGRGVWQAEKLVIATGALSYPKLKAGDFGYKLAKQFGLKVTKTRPGLVPLVFEGAWLDWCKSLAGVSLRVAVSCNGQNFCEDFLFTHKGISGPAVLQISNYWQLGMPLEINLLPQLASAGRGVGQELANLKQNNGLVRSWLNNYWPRRFTQAFMEKYSIPDSLANVADDYLVELEELLTAWQIYPSGTEGYAKAEVTLGGVDTDGVSSKNLEAKNQSGLYFIGEVLDVTGQLGGYNFQWAWASAYAAAESF